VRIEWIVRMRIVRIVRMRIVRMRIVRIVPWMERL
jgi:hypothetical protein